ncbi:MAG: flippase-like domain-containing protein [Nitrospinae bacterium]|nr:flippase-like domain-containing protein [Nitrospinota bacterium]
MKRYIPYIVLLSLVFLAGYYLYNHQNDLRTFFQFRPLYIFYMTAAGIAQFFISGFFNRAILKPCSITIKTGELFAIAVMASIGNYVLPFRGGLGLRAIYLKRKHNFPYSYFMSGMAGIYLVFFLTNSLLGLASMALLYFYRGVASPPLCLIFGFVLFLVFLPFLASFKGFAFSRKLPEFIGRAITGWLQVARDPVLIFQLVVLTAINSVTNIVLLHYGFLSSSVRPDILELLMISSLLSVSGLVNITPAGLGIQEAAIVFSSNVLGISMAQSLMASLFVRFVSIALAVTLAPFLGRYFLDKESFGET